MLFPQLRINLADDVYARHVSIARKTGHLFSLSVINNTLQIVREEKITNDGKRGNGGPGIRKAFRFTPSRNTDQKKKNFHSYSIICSIISSFYIVIDSARSSRVYYNFVLTSCKLKFLTYHLRQQFSRDLSGGTMGTRSARVTIEIAIDQTISAFRFSTCFREIFSGPKNYFKDIKSLLHSWWVCPCIIYDSCIHSFLPSRGAILVGRLST